MGGGLAFKNNIVKNIIKFIYEIITRFGCPAHFISDQRSHFINKTIEMLVVKFMVVHHKSTIYYPKEMVRLSRLITLGIFLAKLVNTNHDD